MGTPSTLPVDIAVFVGRDRERAAVSELLADTRVVTLTGAGGCGKTRLASVVARDLTCRFPGGVCWVDLAGVREPEMVATAVGAAAGVQVGSGQALADALAEQCHGQDLLIVLDNCEHLVATCAGLVDQLVGRGPRWRILTTSREPLLVEGETTFDVAPLPVPDTDARSARTVMAAEAARLFEVRARQVRPDYRISDDDAPAVADICRRLDGIPLALELAAARLRVLSPAQVAAGLTDRFALLTGGLRNAPPRQQTLEGSIDWSYELLDDRHRLALARLSVFAGSFELDAAEAVLGDEPRGTSEALSLITALAERSLLQVEERNGRARYRLLETIRAYAWRRLPELDDRSRVRDRHLAFHVGLAHRARAGLTGGRPEPWVERLASDLDDLRAAMDWAAESADLQSLLGLAVPIVRFWFGTDLSAQLHRRLHAAGDGPGAGADERARRLTTAAVLALSSGEPASAYRSADQAIQASRAAGADDALALGLGVRAWSGVASGLARNEEVNADIEAAVDGGEQSGDPATRAFVLVHGGAALLRTSTIDAGCRLLEEAVAVSEASDVVFHQPAAHASLGLWPVLSGRFERTRRHARRGLELSRRVGRPEWEAVALAGLGAADVFQGEHDRATTWLSAAQQTVRRGRLDHTPFGVAVHHWLALHALASGDLDTLRTRAEDIVGIGRDHGNRLDEAIGEWLRGTVARMERRPDEARTHLERSRTLSSDPRVPFAFGRAALGLAHLARLDGDLDEAWELAHEGLLVLTSSGDRVGSAGALEVVADIAVDLGMPAQALRLFAASDRFRADTGIQRFPGEAHRFEPACTTARAALEDTAATACWEAGGELSLEDAVAYARRSRGERGRPPSGWASLTPTERDLVRLVAQGHTNAEIGERLFISVNTVKKHLSHVYRKVDVEGRASLAAEVTRRGV